jgi:hypothetical protein
MSKVCPVSRQRSSRFADLLEPALQTPDVVEYQLLQYLDRKAETTGGCNDPDTAVNSRTFGQIRSAGPAREIQLALKLNGELNITCPRGPGHLRKIP